MKSSVVVVLMSLGLASMAFAQETPSPAFKGDWQGPTRQVLPGPGLRPGQTLEDYFGSLPTGCRTPTPMRVLLLGGSRSFHHDSVPAAMNMVYAAGKRSCLWITHFATDYALVNPRGGRPMRAKFPARGPAGFRRQSWPPAIPVTGA